MKVKYKTLLNNKVLISIDKVFRFFGYCIVLIGNTETGLVDKFFIDKKWS